MTSSTKLLRNLLFIVFIYLASCSSSGTGEEFSIERYSGKWLVLNYWAEWCAPCLKEIPELNQLQRDYPDQLAVAAVNFDGVEGEELVALSRRMGITFEILPTDPADVLRLSRPASLPTTYIFNPEGILSAKLVGPQTVESLLKQTSIDPQE